MSRLAGFGAAILILVLAALTPLWLQVGTGWWVVAVIAFAHGLAMLGMPSWVGVGAGAARVGPADYVTMARAMLGSACVALAVLVLNSRLTPPTWWFAPPAVLALVLDGVDGQLARRTGTASAQGARYDMECDAMLLMILCIPAALTHGLWVLLIGLMRYLFVIVALLVPKLRGTDAPTLFARVVALIQGVALVVAVSPVLPYRMNLIVLAIALILLVISFGRQTVTLLRPVS